MQEARSLCKSVPDANIRGEVLHLLWEIWPFESSILQEVGGRCEVEKSEPECTEYSNIEERSYDASRAEREAYYVLPGSSQGTR